MCGIAGLLNLRALAPDLRSAIQQMTDALARRGPDGYGIWLGDGIALGHTRLSIIDLSTSASQPMVDQAGKIIITFNGEIYNYIELRTELVSLGYQFRSNSDTEVLLNAFIEWGSGAFSRMIGMWAVALFDSTTRRMFLSRDRFGIKPLFLKKTEHTFLFSSTIKAILATECARPRLNASVVKSYLLDQSVDESRETFFDGIISFPPGAYAVIEMTSEGIRYHQERYWNPVHFIEGVSDRNISFNEASDSFREKLSESVRIHTRSDVEVASCLSGGMDSSSIVSLLATMPQGTNIRKVFSAVFPNKPYDESQYSALIARQNNLTHFNVESTAQSFISEIDEVISAQEQPFGSTGVYVQWKLFQRIGKEKIKVVLDGQGADEYLGGYFSFLFPYALDCLTKFHILRATQAIHSYVIGNKFKHYAWQRMSGLMGRLFGLHSSAFSSPFADYLSTDLFTPSNRQSCKMPAYDPILNGLGFKKALVRYLTCHSLPSLLRYEDMNSMWFSIESRVPFLDHRLVEFALTLPSNYLIDGRWTKRLLRNGMRGIVPTAIIDRRDKIGFGNPEQEWVEALIRHGSFRDLLNNKMATEVLNVPMFSKLLDTRHERRIDSNYLWRVFNLLSWQQQYFGPTLP